MTETKKRAAALGEALRKAYPEARCSLHFETPFQLLVATILSAQCTDEKVNQVTPALFKRCATPASLAAMAQENLERMIHATGFFRNKAKALIGAAGMIARDFEGEVPGGMDDLLRLPGVARKTANVVLGNAYGRAEGVVVDTHVGRLARRMGLTKESDPAKVEADLMRLFPKEEWVVLAHRLIAHGRAVCRAKSPSCGACSLARLCPKVGVPESAGSRS